MTSLAKQLARAGLQSGSIMLVADTTTQLLIEKRALPSTTKQKHDGQQQLGDKSSNHCYEPQRTMRWSLAGLFLHGPYFFYSFQKIDRYFAGGSLTLRKVIQKTAVAQFVAFPPYLVGLFAFMGIMDDSVPHVIEHTIRKVPDAFLGGCVFWPVANMINFAFIPANIRVPYLAGVGSIWNCFLSWLNALESTKSPTKKEPTEAFHMNK